MSNISPFGGKNPPWARGVNNPSSGAIVGQANPLQPQLLAQSSLGTMAAAGMVQYQQSQQVFQTQMGIQQQNLGLGMSQLGNAVGAAVAGNLASQMSANQMFSQVNAVSYPTPRTLNPNSFQNATVASVPNVQNQQANSTKQRVFTGTVTKVHDNFGFVDEDVFFQTSACVKGSNPVVGDRVLVEASFNANMPFKWNATRIQVLPMSGSTTSSRHSTSSNNTKGFNSSSNAYNAVPPPSENSNSSYGGASRGNQRSKGLVSGRTRSREREREDDEIERKKRREERTREREEKDKKSPLPRRRSPKRRRTVIVPRYMVHIPKIALDLPEADVLEVRRRYTNLYVPSDFFNSQFRWVDAFPPNAPFSLNKPCSFHIMHKDIDPVGENPAVLEPSDADYLFSAKVMLMSMPTMQEVYQKCCSVAEERDHRDRDSEERDFVHPTRLVSFLVGLRGKNETMAVGGPWSPSLDGPDPDKNPSTLINTAIRTCRALTGIDLSTCTQWYRFVELYYRRGESTHKGKVIPARVETVVLFLPDVWSCVPTRLEWDSLQTGYRKQLERRLRPDDDDGPTAADGAKAATAAADAPDEKEEDISMDEKLQPTHYSELDPKTMTVGALRTELKARSLNSKGLKSQLVARLTKILKSEAEKTDEEAESVKESDVETIEVISNDEKQDSKEEDEIKIDEKERLLLEKRYALPDSQHIIVHPNKVAKSGKFDCCVMSLSLLLDYRPEDTKEHSFEVSLFAELFNEMLMRDFGFNIYKALRVLPEKPKEEKDEKRKNKDEDRKKDDDKDKKKDRDDDKTKKDDRKDEREYKKEDTLKRKRDDDGDDEKEKENGDDEDDRKDRKSSEKDRDKKKKDRPKLVTKDPHLLLSFVYFDQTHCGYIFEKDIEDLLFTLGLSLSRAQVKKIVSKAITRDSLHYRKLTDKPKDEEAASQLPKTDENDSDDLTLGNKKLLPVFSQKKEDFPVKRARKGDVPQLTEEQIAEGFVMYEGGLLHVGKLMEKLKRVERACSDTESRLVELKENIKKLQDKNTKASSTIKDLSSELKEYKEKLQVSNSSLDKMSSAAKLFHGTLKDIRKQIEPVIHTNLYSDFTENKSINHETRWSDPDDVVKVKEEKEVVKNESLDVIKIKQEVSEPSEMEIDSLEDNKDSIIIK